MSIRAITTALNRSLSTISSEYPNQQDGEKTKTVLTGLEFTVVKACSGKTGYEIASIVNIRIVKTNETVSKNIENISHL